MTTRHAGYLIVLDHDIREDDAEATITALRMVKGVQSVQPVVADVSQAIASTRRDGEWQDRLNALTREMRGW